jgi:hypothetical protein
LVHLICLRCSHANASDAKFCGECGAGLLRKFCRRCHAINDAESHFCNSCGEALPAQPSVPLAPSTTPPADVPALTDVFTKFSPAPDAEAVPALDPLVGARPTEPPTEVAASKSDAQPPGAVTTPALMPSQRAVLFGFVGGAAVLLGLALWSRSDQTSRLSTDAPAASLPPVVAPAGALSNASTPSAQPPLDASQPTPSAATATPAQPTVPAQEAGKQIARRIAPEAQVAAQPPAAGTRSVTPPRAAPVLRNTPPPAAVVPECTPQADALGLCAPGAKVGDKAGSR